MHCINRIETAIKALEGVDFAEADLVKLSLTVDFEPPADDKIIRETLESIGYPAVI